VSGVPVTRTDVLIIGAGPSGLTAAAGLAARRVGEVLVLDREQVAGGIPRHCEHLGFGMRDMRAFTSGPAYARRLVAAALRAGAQIRTNAMVTGWSGEPGIVGSTPGRGLTNADGECTVEVTSPRGVERISARAIVLATGARERPRAARVVAGDRPDGVYTTGQLQNLVHLQHGSPGTRAVIVGAELVSWSAALTLREAGCRPVLLTSEYRRPESYTALAVGGRIALRVEVATRTRVARIDGRRRVAAVELEHLDTLVRRQIACDVVVFTGDWISDNELARAGGLQMDHVARGPVIDTAQATSVPGVFAIGNLVHPADTADIAALDGRAVIEPVLDHLRMTATLPYGGAEDPRTRSGARLLPGDSLEWITPGLLSGRFDAPGGRLSCRPRRDIVFPTVTVSQAGEVRARRRLAWAASPGRVYRIPASVLSGVEVTGPDVTINLTGRQR
jgi:thioredoxin reductase